MQYENEALYLYEDKFAVLGGKMEIHHSIAEKQIRIYKKIIRSICAYTFADKRKTNI
jgi:hypothetical protein